MLNQYALYIHIPFCIRKCPYCDFNSQAISLNDNLETEYTKTLIQDLQQEINKHGSRTISSIYIGGGTPTLLQTKNFATLFNFINTTCLLKKNIEISIEANPGTINLTKLKALKKIGINRISIGVQSFQNDKLKLLGRIHDRNEAIKAIENAHKAGFSNINLDLMHGLPTQSLEDAESDLNKGIALNPTHISWYQLTLEQGTLFGRKPPANIPDEEKLWQIEQRGKKILCQHKFNQYEVSAYSKTGFKCQHNLNYWRFGDYLAIGAGAHGKISNIDKHGEMSIRRYAKLSNYRKYIAAIKSGSFGYSENKIVKKEEIPFEFMLNALRLKEKINIKLFTETTGVNIKEILPLLKKAQQKKLIDYTENYFVVTSLGHKFLNDLIELFVN